MSVQQFAHFNMSSGPLTVTVQGATATFVLSASSPIGDTLSYSTSCFGRAVAHPKSFRKKAAGKLAVFAPAYASSCTCEGSSARPLLEPSRNSASYLPRYCPDQLRDLPPYAQTRISRPGHRCQGKEERKCLKASRRGRGRGRGEKLWASACFNKLTLSAAVRRLMPRHIANARLQGWMKQQSPRRAHPSAPSDSFCVPDFNSRDSHGNTRGLSRGHLPGAFPLEFATGNR